MGYQICTQIYICYMTEMFPNKSLISRDCRSFFLINLMSIAMESSSLPLHNSLIESPAWQAFKGEGEGKTRSTKCTTQATQRAFLVKWKFFLSFDNYSPFVCLLQKCTHLQGDYQQMPNLYAASNRTNLCKKNILTCKCDNIQFSDNVETTGRNTKTVKNWNKETAWKELEIPADC